VVKVKKPLTEDLIEMDFAILKNIIDLLLLFNNNR
jgi:predicted unusual protein kinase regulating ubiquinone biosynthesis (AarF/ABC1/UbiB family)